MVILTTTFYLGLLIGLPMVILVLIFEGISRLIN